MSENVFKFQPNGSASDSISRKAAYPAICDGEERWLFTEEFYAPHELPSDTRHMSEFGHLIWDNEADSIIDGYDATPAELALLCREDGWMETCHMDWVARKVNLQSRSTLCLVADTLLPGLLCKVLQDKAKGKLESITQLCVAINVGMTGGQVFVGDGKKPGCHWTVVVVNLEQGRIVYCDSLGWQMPQKLISRIKPLLQIFCKEREFWDVVMAHVPSATSSPHVCTAMCLNYPLQKCGTVCGIVAIVFMAVSALSENLLQRIFSPRSPESAFFLNTPTVFNRFLRRQVIRWFVTGIVDLDFASPSQSTPNADTANSEGNEDNHNSDTSTTPGTANGEDAQHQRTGTRTAPNPGKKSTTDEYTYNKTNSESANFSAKPKTGRTSEKHAKGSPKTNHDSEDPGKSDSSNTPNSQPNKKKKTSTSSNYAQQKKDTHDHPKSTTNPNADPDDEHQSTSIQQTHQSHSTQNRENGETARKADDQNSGKGGIGTGHNDRKKTKCPYCEKMFSNRSNLYKHVRHLHPGKDRIKGTYAMTYHCNICNSFSTNKVQDLSFHYEAVHEKTVYIREAHLPSMDDFDKWRTQTEKETLSMFARGRGARTTPKHTVYYYKCNRSGSVRLKPHSERKRALKTQGTSKINYKCTAFMTVYWSRRDGAVRVLYCTDHVGHELEPAHLRRKQTTGKHTPHAVQMKVDPSITPVQNTDEQRSENNEEYHAPFVLDNTHANGTDIYVDNKLLKNELKTKIKELDDLIDRTHSTAALEAMLQFINSALMVGRALEESASTEKEKLEVEVKLPPNKNNKTQRSKSSSTSRKTKKKKLSLNKPNSAQVETLTEEHNQVTSIIWQAI